MRLSERISNLGESATFAVTRQAMALLNQGVDVITFGVGEPDFRTPAHITEAAKAALDAGHTGYAVPASGLLVTKQAVCQKFNRENGLQYEPSQVIITIGGKEALYLGFMSVLDPGDEVVIPAPYWVSYPPQVQLAGGRPVIIETEERCGFRVTPEQLQAAITPRTRIVVMNYPSNPVGHSYTREELQALAEVLAGRDIMVFADEIYDNLIYGDHVHFSWATLSPETYAKTLTINATSKTHAMTGWRTGYAAGPAELIRAMAKLQSQMTSGTAHFSHYAVVAALTGTQDAVRTMKAEFDVRRRLTYQGLVRLPGVTCLEPQGGFYCFPNVSAAYQRLGVQNSIEFASRLLDEKHVAVVPGSAFGCDGHVRIAYALSRERIEEGLRRLQAFLS